MSKLSKLINHPVDFVRDSRVVRSAIEWTGATWLKAPKPTDGPPQRPKPPKWFHAKPGSELSRALDAEGPVYLFIPWIREHGDRLIDSFSRSDEYAIAPLDLFPSFDAPGRRRSVSRYVRKRPDMYRRMLLHRLTPIRDRISGAIFTFDWHPVMRGFANVCEELEIPRILVPHESVFFDKDKYYRDDISGAACPTADVVFCWGDLQRDIFESRGFPPSRIHRTGAPKFDRYHEAQPKLAYRQFCRLFGLHPDRELLLFAAQPMDLQLDQSAALDAQAPAIEDLLDFAEQTHRQLLVRLPPSKDDILPARLRERLSSSSSASVDDAVCYLVEPEEAVLHASLVSSVNSTMLFEAVLAGVPALSACYIDFVRIWESVGIPKASHRAELFDRAAALLEGRLDRCSEEGLEWASRQFSIGRFDGRASKRIAELLATIGDQGSPIELRSDPLKRILDDGEDNGVDVIAIASPENDAHRYLLPMLRARTRVYGGRGMKDIVKMGAADVFVQWGITPTHGKVRMEEVRVALGRPKLIVEDGFVRSIDIGLSGEPGLSLILDDTTAYYDATRPSRLERLLQSERDPSETERERARALMARIVRERISKYNHTPREAPNLDLPTGHKVLLVDQRRGDQSIESGLANASSFDEMLRFALRERPDSTIVVKRHPDAISGGKQSSFDERTLREAAQGGRIRAIYDSVNPYAILDQVDEVFVVTSGMGFEALMAGKPVRCFGAPFYAGWGLTEDAIAISRRTRRRTLEDVFHFAYIESSRYFDPRSQRVCELEAVLDYIVEARPS